MSEQTPPEDVLPIVVGDHTRGAPAAGGARFVTITRRDPVDGSPAHGPKQSGGAGPLNWGLVDEGNGKRQVETRVVAGERGSTPVVDGESGLEAAFGGSFAVEQLREGEAPVLALRITGSQIDPGLGVSTLLRKGWRPRAGGASGTRTR